ncbi:MAG: 2-oxoglutarate dehydrogenase complex dihydrolipoyllysine-residue succinyltransferase [Planctomycetota bacterium]|nr:2-oxoglutarate dehydrogenase complex dihydrolipoyllysine-residue succinyltransferase [Planctomycetota bacterium]
MPVELKVPSVGESVTEVQIGEWKKNVGDNVALDEVVVEIESDKATVDLLAPSAGKLTKLLKQQGEKADVGEVIGYLGDSAEPDSASEKSADTAARSGEETSKKSEPQAAPVTTETHVTVEKKRGQTAIGAVQPGTTPVMPAAQRAAAQEGVNTAQIAGTGPGGRVLKEDVLRAAEGAKGADASVVARSEARPAPPGQLMQRQPTAEKSNQAIAAQGNGYSREEEFVVMSPIRRRIAERLVEAQQSAALLTTFNEVDMTEIMALRAKFKDIYQERYGVKLGFMSFFVKAVVDALKQVPQVNAEVREPHVVYKNYYDIGIAVGGGKGLVVPILRNAEFMSFADIEKTIGDFGRRAGENKIKLEELQGGTFTISNGGVYGSLLSTPIVNPPQSGILGLHAIQDRPVARNGQVVIRPMMYLALTYDHRIVDGREAVTFLKRVKEGIEDPTRLLIEV